MKITTSLYIDDKRIVIELIGVENIIQCWRHNLHDDPYHPEGSEMQIGSVWIPHEMGMP